MSLKIPNGHQAARHPNVPRQRAKNSVHQIYKQLCEHVYPATTRSRINPKLTGNIVQNSVILASPQKARATNRMPQRSQGKSEMTTKETNDPKRRSPQCSMCVRVYVLLYEPSIAVNTTTKRNNDCRLPYVLMHFRMGCRVFGCIG